MRTPQELERGLAAPETLGLNSRVEIREAAKHLLAELPTGTGRLVIDLSATRTIDSAGLGALMLIQRMAAWRICTRVSSPSVSGAERPRSNSCGVLIDTPSAPSYLAIDRRDL